MEIRLSELVQRLGAKACWLDDAELALTRDSKDGGAFVNHLAAPEIAIKSSLSFLIGSRIDSAKAAKATLAGAVIVEKRYAAMVARPLVVEKPLVALAKANHWLPVAKSAHVQDSLRSEMAPPNLELDQPTPTSDTFPSDFDDLAYLHPSAVVGTDVVVGHSSSIGANACIEGDVRIGSFCKIGANVTIKGPVKIGNRVHIDANCVIGSEPFMYVEECDHWLKVPGFFGVVVKDDVDIGSGTTIDQGLVENTVVESGVKLDSQIHLGHGVKLGRDTILAGRTTVAGEVVIGANCKIGGACAISEGVTLADNVTLLGMSAVTRSLPLGGEYTSAWPVQLRLEWWKQLATLKSIAKG